MMAALRMFPTAVQDELSHGSRAVSDCLDSTSRVAVKCIIRAVAALTSISSSSASSSSSSDVACAVRDSPLEAVDLVVQALPCLTQGSQLL